MTIQKGVRSIRREHGKNFIQKQAQARLDEAVKPYQQQGLNALGVDYHEVYLYLNTMSSRVCTCKQAQQVLTEMDTEIEDAPKYKGIAQSEEISINWNKPLFGEPNEANFNTDYDEYDFEESPNISSPSSIGTSVIEASVDCGICYRSGFVPGFEQYGRTRFVYTSQDLIDQNSINIDRSEAPHVIDRLHKNGWALFALSIPKYFKSVTYSVRNGYEVLNEKLWNGSAHLTLSDVQNNAGRTIFFRVQAPKFTHVDITFDLGTDPILANIAQLTKLTDWTLFETVGNLNVILPMTVPELPVGSVVIVPKKGFGLRITDVPQLRTSKGHNLDWACTTRFMQPQEPLRNIAKGFRLF